MVLGVVSIFLVMIMATVALGSAQLPIYEAIISAPTVYHLASRSFSLRHLICSVQRKWHQDISLSHFV
jgi:hypothetical protein